MALPAAFVLEQAYKSLREDPFSPWTISAFYDALNQQEPSSMFRCHVCLDLRGSLADGTIKRTSYPTHDIVYRNLVATSKSGCSICRILHCAVVAFCQNLDIRNVCLSWSETLRDREDSPLNVDIYYDPGTAFNDPQHIQLYREQGKSSLTPAVFPLSC